MKKSIAALFTAFVTCAFAAFAQSVNPNVEPGAPRAKPAPGHAHVGEVLDFVDPAFPSDTLRQTIQETVDRFGEALRASSVPKDVPLTLLPVVGDRTGYVASLMKSAITDAGRKYVVAENDSEWKAIPAHVEWSERKGDILDKETLLKFGALQAARILLVAEIRVAQISDRGVLVEIDAHAADARTANHIWGGVFTRRRYVGAELPVKAIDLPREVRDTLQNELLAKTVASLKDCPALAKYPRIAFVPLSADEDGYATDILREAFVKAGVSLVNLDASSPSEARAILRDKPANKADAFLYGTVRKLREVSIDEKPEGVATNYTVEWTVSVETAGDRLQPYVATIQATGTDFHKNGWWDRVCHHLPFLRGRGWTLVCLIIVLAVVFAVLRATTRVR
ncbi:MAG: hypothetical protein ILM98_05960 [Kiritimatiellae bacterium]|nr:hypothetical protein [Kiritimatiellia bacterium]